LAIDDENAEYSCPVNVIIDGESNSANPVTASSTSTPELQAIVPRFGSVLGGETVTFEGTDFSDSAAATITIDEIDCAV
jgi:hypothetical protein